MKGQQKIVKIVMADDDDDDCVLVREALEESQLVTKLHIVRDGEELMDYLYRRGKYNNQNNNQNNNQKNLSLPNIILLDLNMPKKDGREVLREIKADPQLRQIPIIVLTTSKAQEDIYRSYDLGANSFIIKPMNFASLVEVMRTIGKYWFDIVELPL